MMMMTKTRGQWLCLLAFLFCLLLPRVIEGVFPCIDDAECAKLLNRPDAKCNVDGFCANPYYQGGGCLSSRLGNNKNDVNGTFSRLRRLRVCNSQDPMPEALEKGYCRLSPLNYTEVRIEIQNWDSAVFVTYIMQILLSELLDVPTSIETSFYDRKANFYDPILNLNYGWSDDERALNRSSIHGDCVPFTSVPEDEGYLACAHVISEAWDSFRWTQPFITDGILEPTYPVGQLGREGWHIPLYTVRHDPSLLHWNGLVGEENRRKLAETFKRPVTFQEYCEQVSTSNCSVPDQYAKRPPQYSAEWGFGNDPYSEGWYKEELWRYFVPGVYTGYFRYTDKNNCTLNPKTCTGHIVDMPCGWSSYTEAQTYHLNIALESDGPNEPVGGYWPLQIPDIWRAANATQNHVMMHYSSPDAMTFEFLDSDFSFERITLPRTTQTCTDARRPNKLRCSENKTLRVGLNPNGACDEPPESLQKIFSTGLHHITKGKHIKEELKSPAYDALRSFTISDLRIGEIFAILAEWENRETRLEFGLRDSVCEWVVEHLEILESYLPPSFPRVIEESRKQLHTDPVNIASLSVAVVALTLTVVVTVAVYMLRKKNSINRAQIDFLFLLLTGLFLVSLGSLTMSLPHNDRLCVASVWLTNIGYSLELVPLIVKLTALNQLMRAGRRYRRIDVKPRALYQACAVIGLVVIVFLTIWTVVDAPQEQGFYTLSDDVTPNGEIVIYESFQCKSDWMYWFVICIAWQAFLLLIAAVIAFQNRDFREDLVETRTLAMMIYSHLLFVGLRVATFVIQRSDFVANPTTAQHFRGLLNSFDVIVTLFIYFLPKFLSKNQQDRSMSFMQSNTFISGLRAAAASADADTSTMNLGTSTSRRSNSHYPRRAAFAIPSSVRSWIPGGGSYSSSSMRGNDSKKSKSKSYSSSSSKKESSVARVSAIVENDGEHEPQVAAVDAQPRRRDATDSHPSSQMIEPTEPFTIRDDESNDSSRRLECATEPFSLGSGSSSNDSNSDP